MSEEDAQKKNSDHILPFAWKPGQSGNPAGRPKGSRHKLGENFIAEMHADFQVHGKAVIEKVREKYPDTYLKIIAGMLPGEMNVRITDDLDDTALDKRIQQLAEFLRLEVRIAGTAGREETPRRQEQVIDLQPLPETARISRSWPNEAGTPAYGGKPDGENV